MEKFQYGEAELQNRTFNPRFRTLLEFQVERTRRMFHEGGLLPELVSGRLRWELRCVVLGGLQILKKIERCNYDTLQSRPALSKADATRLLWQALRYRRKLKIAKPRNPGTIA